MLRFGWRWGRGARAFDVRLEKEVAARHFGARHWRRAFAAYSRLAEHVPSDCFVQIRLGDCARALRRHAVAEDAYRTAMAGYSAAGDWTKAAAACRLLVALRPDDGDLPVHLASLESRRRIGPLPYTPEQVTPVRPAGRDLSDIELRGWSDERPHDHWSGVDIDIRGRSRPVKGVGARAEVEGADSPRHTRGAMRTPAPLLVPLPDEPEEQQSSPDDVMPEEVFEELYGALSSAGPALSSFDTTLRHRPALRTPSESEIEGSGEEDEPCTCGRCHICRPTTRRWATS